MVAKLERVNLRDAFPSEVKDLSTWVQDNLDELNNVTGLLLSLAKREQPAGDFSVDLIAEDQSGNKVVIENQLGRRSQSPRQGAYLPHCTRGASCHLDCREAAS